MITTVIPKNHNDLEWLEVVNPNIEEIQYLFKTYNLPQAALQDCLEPNHLPKFEEIEGINFIIFRIYDVECDKKATTIQQLTRKIALFYSPDFIITVQRAKLPMLEHLKELFAGREKHVFAEEVLVKLIENALLTFEAPANQLIDELNTIESKIFFSGKIPKVLEDIYFIKKKSDAMERILILYRDILGNSSRFLPKRTYLRDIQDLHIRLETLYKTILENAGYLINVYFSLSSQRTNEIMQVLTVFSAFFLPLTFIVGVYGMNFEVMPELKWETGYYTVWGLMILIAAGILAWFKRKGWV